MVNRFHPPAGVLLTSITPLEILLSYLHPSHSHSLFLYRSLRSRHEGTEGSGRKESGMGRVSDRRSDTRDERRAAEWTTRRSRVTNEENNGHETRDG